MTEPWDARLARAPEETPTNRIAVALKRAGSRVVEHHDGGSWRKGLTTTYVYDCGCKRTYKADQRHAGEAEYLTACGAHKDLVNLLTACSEQPTIGVSQQEDRSP